MFRYVLHFAIVFVFAVSNVHAFFTTLHNKLPDDLTIANTVQLPEYVHQITIDRSYVGKYLVCPSNDKKSVSLYKIEAELFQNVEKITVLCEDGTMLRIFTPS